MHFIVYVFLFFTCQRWVCHIQNSRTKACCPCFQDSLLPPAYFNPSMLHHTSITQPICQLGFKAVFNRVSAFPVLFPPEHNRETSPPPALNQLCSQLLGSFSVRTMPHTVLNAFALAGIFVKDSTTIQAFARLPFLSCFLLLFPADCFITFLIGSPGQSMNQAVRCGLTGWSRFLRQLIFPVSH